MGMTYDERVALNQKYANRNVLEELAFESEYHKATMSKNEAEFIRWLCGRAFELLKAKKPRLLTVQDFKNNPDVDAQGYLPCWVECNEQERASAVKYGILEPGEDMDMRPVVHGRWLSREDFVAGMWECIVCKRWCEMSGNLYNYCPHCGAKMEMEKR